MIILSVSFGCKSSEKDNSLEEPKSPKEIVEAYLTATNHFNFEAAEKLLIPSKENMMLVETIKKMDKSLPEERKKELLEKEKNALYTEKNITDSTAQVIVSLNKGMDVPIQFNLRKIKNNWLIESIQYH